MTQNELINDIIRDNINKPNRELYRIICEKGLGSLISCNGMHKRRTRLAKKEVLVFNDTSGDGAITIEEKDGYRVISVPQVQLEKPLTSLEDAIEFFKVDTTKYTVDRWKCSAWPTTMKTRVDEMDAVVQKMNYQVSIWLVKNKEAIFADKVFEDFKKHIKDYQFPYLDIKPSGLGSTAGNLLMVNIFDVHLGKLAWGPELHGDSYDLSIAEETFKKAVIDLVDQTKHLKFEKVLFPYGNDFVHVDNQNNSTTKGTLVDTDSRQQKIFMVAWKLLVWAIDYLSQIAPVEAIGIPGNHDYQSTFYIGEILSAWYKDNKYVTIDNAPTSRKYKQWGNVMLMCTHGDGVKNEKLPFIMAQEDKKIWGNTLFRDIHVGHLHHRKAIDFKTVDEQFGVVIWQNSSISATDKWHSQGGFVGNSRCAHAFVYNNVTGFKSFYNFTVMPDFLS